MSEALTEDSAAAAGTGRRRVSQGRWFPVGMFALLLGLELLLQGWSGVHRTELSHYPDEAAHFTNGLLIRDYLRTGLGESPLHFAEEYYLSFPKVALLIWPPST